MYTKELEGTGFDFSNYERNEKLQMTMKQNFKKTGTTICAVMHKDGVVFGADTRATAGSVTMDLECMKLDQLSSSIVCAGAGTAADLFAVRNMMKSELDLQKMNTGNEPRISHIEQRLHDHLYRHQGHIGCALIVGGVDINGIDIVSFFKKKMIMSPHGNSFHAPFTAMGSGSLAALAVLENHYKDGLSEDQAIELAADAIQAGIFYDLGSGSNVNIISVNKKETKTLFNYRVFNKKEFQDDSLFNFNHKVPIIKTIEIKWEKVDEKDNNSMMEIC